MATNLSFLCSRRVCAELVKKYASDARHEEMRSLYRWTGHAWVPQMPVGLEPGSARSAPLVGAKGARRHRTD